MVSIYFDRVSDKLTVEEERKNKVKSDSKIVVHLKGWSCHYLSGENYSGALVGQGGSDQEFGLGHVKSKYRCSVGTWRLES